MKKCFLSFVLASTLCLSLTVSASAANQSGDSLTGAAQIATSFHGNNGIVNCQVKCNKEPKKIIDFSDYLVFYPTNITVDCHSNYEEATITKEYRRSVADPDTFAIVGNALGYDKETILCSFDNLEETINLGQTKNYDGQIFDGGSLSILKLKNGDTWDVVYKLQPNNNLPEHHSITIEILNSADRIYELGGTNFLTTAIHDVGFDIFNSDYVDFSCRVEIQDDDNISTLTFMSSRDGGIANYDAIKEFVGFDFSSNKKLIGDLTIQMHDCVDLEKGAWYENAIIYCSAAGYVTGYGNGKFGPNDSITFAQLATILSKCRASEEYEYYIYNLDHWAKDAMGFAVRNNIFISSDVLTNGKPDVSKWDRPMTREQAVYSIVQYIKFVDLDMPNNAANIPDISSVDVQYRDGVKLAYQYGITSGVDAKGTFNPKAPVTRAEICQMIYSNRL